MLSIRFQVRHLALAVGLCVVPWEPASAVTCPVPSASHPSIGAAVRDGSCTTVTLAAGSFPENVTIERDLALQGAGSASTFVEGFLAVSGATSNVSLSALTVDGTAAGVAGCWREILRAGGGGEVATGPDVVVLQTVSGGTACRLFADDFESGGVLTWSTHAP